MRAKRQSEDEFIAALRDAHAQGRHQPPWPCRPDRVLAPAHPPDHPRPLPRGEPIGTLDSLTGMRLACAVVVVVALASAGCVGSSSSSTSNGGSDDRRSDPAQDGSGDHLHRLEVEVPSGGVLRLRPKRPPHRPPTLTRSPDGGDYEDPTAVCRALTDLVTKLKQPHGLCDCPPQPSGYRAPKSSASTRASGERSCSTAAPCAACQTASPTPQCSCQCLRYSAEGAHRGAHPTRYGL